MPRKKQTSRSERKKAGEWYLGEQFSKEGRAAARKRAKASKVKSTALLAKQKESARVSGEKRKSGVKKFLKKHVFNQPVTRKK